MHSGKGFHTTTLVSEESHPVTALQPLLLSIFTLRRVYVRIQERDRETSHGRVSPEVFEAQNVTSNRQMELRSCVPNQVVNIFTF